MKHNRFHLLLLLLLSLVLVTAAGCGGDDEGDGTTAAATGDEGGGGPDTVTVLSLWGGSERTAFQKVLDGFTAETGIKTKYETARDFLPVIRTRLAAGNPPMVAIVPRPGVMADLAREGSLQSLADLGLDEGTMTDNYAQAWIDLGTVDDELYGITVKANSKSTIWYKPNAFEKDGIEIPATWDDLIAVTDKLKASGKTPWAVGAKDSWTLTDWFENIYVRTAGPDKYSELFGGTLEFTDQSVMDALTEMVKIVNGDNVPGGIQGAMGTAFVDGIGQVFGAKPKAEMYFEGGFVGGIALGEVNPKLVVGEDIAFFPFPTISDEHGSPLIGGGDLAVAFENNDSVKQLMEYLSGTESGETWAATGAIVSPNKTVDVSVYPNELAKAEAEQVAAAEVFRFDGSDLLPGALGEEWGTTLQGIIQDPSKMQSLLAEFEEKAAPEFER